MKVPLIGSLLTLALTCVAASAQDRDNGTDPTKLRRSLNYSFEHMDLGSDASRGTLKAMLELPVSSKTSLRLTLPVVGLDVPGVSDNYALGDVSLRVTHLLDVNRERGIVLQGEIFADSAARRELGNDTSAVKLTGIYAKFLPGGRIFAPAFSHTESIADDRRISESVLDLYYVPKLAHPAWYMTVDPALVKNWEADRLYASFAVTTGRAVGEIGGGLAQVYVKPNIFVGHERPADWSVELGFRIIGF